MNPIKVTFKKIDNFAQNMANVLIPKAAHHVAARMHLSPRTETILGYTAAIAICTTVMMAGFMGAVVAPIVATGMAIFGSPVVAAAIANAIPFGILAGYMGMAMSESSGLSDGYSGYADMKEKIFPSVAIVSSAQPRKDWSQKIRGVFSRVATKALRADQSPQSLPQPARPAPSQP